MEFIPKERIIPKKPPESESDGSGPSLPSRILTDVRKMIPDSTVDDIPMSAINDIEQNSSSYCETNRKDGIERCREDYLRCDESLQKIKSFLVTDIPFAVEDVLKELENDPELKLSKSDGYAVASLVAGGLSGIFGIAGVIPGPVGAGFSVASGVTSLGSTILSGVDSSRSDSTDSANARTGSIVDGMVGHTRTIMKRYYYEILGGVCHNGQIALSDKNGRYEHILSELKKVHARFMDKDGCVKSFKTDIMRFRAFNELELRESSSVPKYDGMGHYAEYDSGNYIVRLNGRYHLAGRMPDGVEPFYLKSETDLLEDKKMPGDEFLKERINNKYLSKAIDLTYVRETNYAMDQVSSSDMEDVHKFLKEAVTPNESITDGKGWLVRKEYTVTAEMLREIEKCFAEPKYYAEYVIFDEDRLDTLGLSLKQKYLVKRAIDNINTRPLTYDSIVRFLSGFF